MTQPRNPTLIFSRGDTRALVVALTWLRPCAALGQALAISAAIGWLHIRLPLLPLATGIAALLFATSSAVWRLRHPWPVGEAEAMVHVAFDLLLLGWALYFTGGASNPFITLLLVPVALSAMALSARGTAGMVFLAAAEYAVLMFCYLPLPDISMHAGTGFRLHLTGMAVNFLIAALLLVVFIGRMTASLHTQREALRRLRERSLRDEGILAVATQAAEAAHELNTPLSTLRTLLPELERGREQDAALRDDLHLMITEVERCRHILRDMVEYGRRQLSGSTCSTRLGEYVRANVERFQLLCPEADIVLHVGEPASSVSIKVQTGLDHALLNLMRNAFEASSQNGSRRVVLDAGVSDEYVEFVISDDGKGFAGSEFKGIPRASQKPDGLGMGLALARSTIERLRGDLNAQYHAGGTRIRIRLPALAGN